MLTFLRPKCRASSTTSSNPHASVRRRWRRGLKCFSYSRSRLDLTLNTSGDKNADVTQCGDFPETLEGVISPLARPVHQHVSDVVSQGLVAQEVEA